MMIKMFATIMVVISVILMVVAVILVVFASIGVVIAVAKNKGPAFEFFFKYSKKVFFLASCRFSKLY